VQQCSQNQFKVQKRFFEKKNIYLNNEHVLAMPFILGVGGSVQFPKGYIKEAAEVVRGHGGLFISDEVQTGFGRTGDFYWGFEGHEIIPDIVTMAKGIGNG
jgi:4-aminobutyrate aminotransferase-like enzyme